MLKHLNQKHLIWPRKTKAKEINAAGLAICSLYLKLHLIKYKYVWNPQGMDRVQCWAAACSYDVHDQAVEENLQQDQASVALRAGTQAVVFSSFLPRFYLRRSGSEKIQLMKDTLTAILGPPKRRQNSDDTEWSAADDDDDDDAQDDAKQE